MYCNGKISKYIKFCKDIFSVLSIHNNSELGANFNPSKYSSHGCFHIWLV